MTQNEETNTTDLATIDDDTPRAPILSEPVDMLAGKTIDELVPYAERFAKSALIPNQYRGKPDDVLVCWMFGASLGINCMQSLTSIAVVNGTPSVYGTSLNALIQAQSNFADIIERDNFDEQPDLKQQWAECEIRFRNGREPVVKRYTYTMAVAAGLTGKDNWKNHPQMMLGNRARAWAGRVAFPGALRGLPVYEELLDETIRTVPATVHDVEPEPPKKGTDGLGEALAGVVGEPTKLSAIVSDNTGPALPPGTVWFDRSVGEASMMTDEGGVDPTANGLELLRSKFVDVLRAFVNEGGEGVPDTKALRQFCKAQDDMPRLPKTLEEVTIATLAEAYDLIIAGEFPS